MRGELYSVEILVQAIASIPESEKGVTWIRRGLE